MEGRHFAVLSSVFLWSVTYLIGFLIISNKFSNGSLFSKINSKFKFLRTIFITTIIFPFLAGIFYGIGGYMERENPIAWGCYIENFFGGAGVLWFLSGIMLFLIMIFGLINPMRIKYSKRLNLFLAYTIIQTFGFLMLIIYLIFINYFSGDLNGKDSSCW